jgi:hypothetical protein
MNKEEIIKDLSLHIITEEKSRQESIEIANFIYDRIAEEERRKYIDKLLELSEVDHEKLPAFCPTDTDMFNLIFLLSKHKIQQDFLREVLPCRVEEYLSDGREMCGKEHNECRQEIINNALNKWGIIL